jgi:hypothetical protein
MTEEERGANDSSSDQDVQQERTSEVDTEPLAVVVAAELEVSGYGILLTVSAAE